MSVLVIFYSSDVNYLPFSTRAVDKCIMWIILHIPTHEMSPSSLPQDNRAWTCTYMHSCAIKSRSPLTLADHVVFIRIGIRGQKHQIFLFFSCA